MKSSLNFQSSAITSSNHDIVTCPHPGGAEVFIRTWYLIMYVPMTATAASRMLWLCYTCSWHITRARGCRLRNQAEWVDLKYTHRLRGLSERSGKCSQWEMMAAQSRALHIYSTYIVYSIREEISVLWSYTRNHSWMARLWAAMCYIRIAASPWATLCNKIW